MANARPPGNAGAGATPQLRLGIDVARLRSDIDQVGQSFRGMSRETVQIAREQSRQVTTLLRAQQAQVSADARSQSQVRIQQARAESIAQQQAARTASQVAIHEERRKTAAFNAEIRARQRAQAQAGTFGQFAGAALGGLGGPAGAILGGLAGGAPALAGGLAVSAGVRLAADSTRAASNLRESINKTDVAFRENSRTILEWSQTSARALGQSRQQALEAASGFGLMFQSMELGAQQSVNMSKALVELAADLASINNATPDEALTKLRAGIVGEIEPLRTWGILLDEASTKQKAMEMGLASSADELTQQDKVMARYALILEQTTAQQGDFARTSGDLANQQRILQANTADLGAAFGQDLYPGITRATQALNDFIETYLRYREARQRDGSIYEQSFYEQRGLLLDQGPQFRNAPPRWMTSATPYAGPPRTTPAFDDDQVAALRRRDEGFTAIERQSTLARLDEVRSYGRQVENIERTYQKTVLREAQDFARQRENAERKLQMSILDVAQDSARQRVQWEAETERQISEARTKTAERIADIEEKYNRDQERRAAEHRDNLADAAGRLDAKAVAEEQRNFARANEQAKQARDEQVQNAQDGLQEQIDNQREALQRRIDEQKANDAQRINDMKAAFEEQKAQEDAEREIRLNRQAEDHNDQLIELARQHADRIQQIKDQAAEERDQWTEESNAFLEKVGVHNQAWLDEQERINNGVLQRHTELLNAQRQALLVPGHPSFADPYADRETPYPYAPPVAPSGGGSINNSSSRSVTINEGAVQINTLPGQSPFDIAAEVDKRLFQLLEQLGK